MQQRQWFAVLTTLATLALCACGGGTTSKPGKPVTAPPGEPAFSKYGNPSSYEINGETYKVLPTARGYSERGKASWYGEDFHGKRTSSGEPYNMHAMTAAHRTLPLPSYVRVTNLENRREILVRINDRGPFADNRIIDLSFAAATELGLIRNGVAEVEVVAVDPVDAAAGSARSRPSIREPQPAATAPVRTAQPAANDPNEVLAPDEIPPSSRPPVVITETTGDSTSVVEVIEEPVVRELPPDAPPVRIESSGPKRIVMPAPVQGYYLQTGAFSEPKNAESQADRLRKAGFDSVGVYPTRGILKVRLGPYTTSSAADDDRRRLADLGMRAYIVEE